MSPPEPTSPAAKRPLDARQKPDPEALRTLESGIERYLALDLVGAHALFADAHRRAMNEPRVMSWHGVTLVTPCQLITLVLVAKDSNLGVLYCDQALRLAGPEPELLLNQARVHLALGQRERAVRAIQRGLERAPEHPALKAAQETLGWRRRPVLPFLSRGNFVNRGLGRLRHRFRGSPSATAPEQLAATLGLPSPPTST
jgi:hypothetical protein